MDGGNVRNHGDGTSHCLNRWNHGFSLCAAKLPEDVQMVHQLSDKTPVLQEMDPVFQLDLIAKIFNCLPLIAFTVNKNLTALDLWSPSAFLPW